MSRRHNISIIGLVGLGAMVIFLLGESVVADWRQHQAKKNPYEGITRPRVYAESPYAGEDSAALILFEFGDFACPACRDMEPVVERILARYGDKLVHVWKDFPIHPDISERAAIAARCAHSQGKFWPYHDWLFAKQADLRRLDFREGARELGLDEKKFSQCLADKKAAELVERDFLEGQALGVEQTPLFVLGEAAFGGIVSFEDFESIVVEELGKVGK